MPVTRLPQVRWPTTPPPELAGAAHRSRGLQERLAAGDASASSELQEEYDGQAPEWLGWTSTQPDYLVPLMDALDRGLADRPTQLVVEVGAGAGPATDLLAERLPGQLVAVDLAWEMLIRATAPGPKVQADVARLPIRTGMVDLLVAVNSVVDWPECWRVLQPHGSLLLVSSFGHRTPIYTSVDQVLALTGDAPVLTSEAGHGEWLLVDRPS